MQWIRWAAVALLVLVLPCGTTIAQTGAPSAPPQLRGDPMRYYQQRFDIPDFLVSWAKMGHPGAEGVMGFLSGVFTKDVRVIGTVVDAKLDPQTQRAVIIALVLAGKPAEARDAIQKWAWPLEQNQKIFGLTPLLRQKVSSPEQFDMLWGASFATADPAYVRPIYDAYDATAATPGIDVADIVTVALSRRSPNQDALKAMAQKYGRETFARVVIAASALWSLDSNAQQHKFVGAALESFLKEKPGSAGAKGIVDLRARRGVPSR
jgi:hypothetical protein